MPDDQEHCPRCKEGLYFTVAETEENLHLHCFYCQNHESRVKPGYHVVEPGAPITPIPAGGADPGGVS